MSESWYYSSAGKAVGPHTFEEMQLMAASGKITPQDQICSDGQTWQAAAAVAGLQFGAPTQLGYQAPSQTAPTVTPLAISLFKQSGLWVRIFSVILIVTCALMVVGGIVMIGMGFALPSREAPQLFLIGAMYLAMVPFYIIPCYYLSRYASQAKSFATFRQEGYMESALQAQKSFWKYVVIFTLVVFGLYILFIVGMIIVAVVMHR